MLGKNCRFPCFDAASVQRSDCGTRRSRSLNEEVVALNQPQSPACKLCPLGGRALGFRVIRSLPAFGKPSNYQCSLL